MTAESSSVIEPASDVTIYVQIAEESTTLASTLLQYFITKD